VASVCVPTVARAGSEICSCLAVAFDFNADGKADLIRSGPSGIRVDVLDGAASVANGTFPNGGGALSLRAVGHLNHDFNADFVTQGAGHARVSFVNAAGIATAGTLYLRWRW
jgi:hypothetical protein